jgi:hypothetical protein
MHSLIAGENRMVQCIPLTNNIFPLTGLPRPHSMQSYNILLELNIGMQVNARYSEVSQARLCESGKFVINK